MRPMVQYAKSGDVHIAYQVLGDGPVDIVLVPGWLSNVGLMGENPTVARFHSRLTSFSRLIVFDKRGTGMSDRTAANFTLEERADDLRAVMDAAGSSQAFLFGISEGGSLAMLFAASCPERTVGLVLFAPFAKRIWSEDYPWAPTPEQRQEFYDAISNDWSTNLDIVHVMPSLAHDPEQVRFWGDYMRMSSSPSTALHLAKLNTEIDVRSVLGAIRAPTLAMIRTGDRDVKVEEVRWIASQISNAKFVELEGNDHVPFAGDSDAVADQIQEFVTGQPASARAERVLATVLFVDIVGSTQRANLLGDAKWAGELQSFQSTAERFVQNFSGNIIKFTGDGLLATFNGPGRAGHCALRLVAEMNHLGLDIRCGLHCGEIELLGDDIGGIAVHIAARVMDLAGPGRVLATRTIRDLTSGACLQFNDPQERSLKGIDETCQIYTLSGT